MLYYLDNWLSVSPNASGPAQSGSGLRQGLNENYARELMELHTLGVDGGYTEKDVREVARCFTGWTIRRPREQAEFQFNPRLHDDGAKVVLGTAIPAGGGIGDGLKVIDLLSRHPATAKLVASKLARRFVADEPPPGLVDRAAGAFRSSDGDLTTVLRTLVLSEEFFAPAAYRAKIKKPLEFVSSALRVTGSQTQITHGLLRYLARMGEPLFLAQAPNGYSDYGGAWVSPDMLLTRINFASDLVANKIPGSWVEEHTVTNTRALAALIAPDGLSSATQAALGKADGRGQAALLLAAPEFQRR
jgi:uncharacterized protein (DUF1800 family)